MNHLAIATLELTVDDPQYEKVQKTFAQYANQEAFKRRVESGRKFNVFCGGKEMPKEINYNLLHKVSSNWSNNGWKRERAERELFKGFI